MITAASLFQAHRDGARDMLHAPPRGARYANGKHIALEIERKRERTYDFMAVAGSISAAAKTKYIEIQEIVLTSKRSYC